MANLKADLLNDLNNQKYSIEFYPETGALKRISLMKRE